MGPFAFLLESFYFKRRGATMALTLKELDNRLKVQEDLILKLAKEVEAIKAPAVTERAPETKLKFR